MCLKHNDHPGFVSTPGHQEPYSEFVIWMCWLFQEIESMISGLTYFLKIELFRPKHIIQIIIIQRTK